MWQQSLSTVDPSFPSITLQFLYNVSLHLSTSCKNKKQQNIILIHVPKALCSVLINFHWFEFPRVFLSWSPTISCGCVQLILDVFDRRYNSLQLIVDNLIHCTIFSTINCRKIIAKLCKCTGALTDHISLRTIWPAHNEFTWQKKKHNF